MPHIQIGYIANLADEAKDVRLRHFPGWGFRTFAKAKGDFAQAMGGPATGCP